MCVLSKKISCRTTKKENACLACGILRSLAWPRPERCVFTRFGTGYCFVVVTVRDFAYRLVDASDTNFVTLTEAIVSVEDRRSAISLTNVSLSWLLSSESN